MGDNDCEILEKYENPINSHDEDNSFKAVSRVYDSIGG
jgi:hypothetical protein